MAETVGQVWKLTVDGRPVSKKNSKEIAWVGKGSGVSGKRPIIVSNRKADQWEKSAARDLAGQWGSRPPLDGELGIVVVSYRHPRQPIDVDNLLPAPLDALQLARVVKNDRRFDVALSIRRTDRDRPRVEMYIYEEAADLLRFGASEFGPGVW